MPAGWRVGDRVLGRDRFVLMGVLNVTPDSFYDGGSAFDVMAAVVRAETMMAEGATIIDVGGESTRPGSAPVAADEQIRRVIPVIEKIAGRTAVSIDTRSAVVARAAIEAGAVAVNDTAGLRDEAMRAVVASTGVSAVIMHSRGEPRTMQEAPRYEDVVGEVRAELAARLGDALAAGIERDRIAVDVGIGFAKTAEHSRTLMRRLGAFEDLGVAEVLGVSRKSFLGVFGGGETPDERLSASVAAAVVGHAAGIRIFRVHDVGETRKALSIAAAIGKEEES